LGPKFQAKAYRILAFIAARGPVHKGEIEKAMRPKIDHPTIHKVVKQLASLHAIEAYPTENPIVHRYGLTPIGLIILIRQLKPEEDHAAFDQLAEKHGGKLPRILDIWADISKGERGRMVRQRLQMFAKNTIKLWSEYQAITGSSEVLVRKLMDDFWDPEGDPIDLIGFLDRDVWMAVLKENEMMRSRAMEVIQGRMQLVLDRRTKEIETLQPRTPAPSVERRPT